MPLSTYSSSARISIKGRSANCDHLVLCSILLVVLLITITAFLRNDVVPPENPSWYWRLKVNWHHVAHIVIAGNSRSYRGLDPSVFEQRFEQCKVLNAGFSGAVWSRGYLDYVEVLLIKKNINWVIMGIDPRSLGKPIYNRSGIYEKNGFGTAQEEDAKSHMPVYWEAKWSNLTQRLRPFLIFQPVDKKNDQNYIQRFHFNGWVESDWVRPDPEYYTRRLKEFKGKLRKVDPETYKHLMERIRLWKNKGISVLAFRPPTSPQTKQLEDELCMYDEKKLATDIVLSGGCWIDLDQNMPYACYDGSHLNSDSAKKLSSFLADSIERCALHTQSASR